MIVEDMRILLGRFHSKGNTSWDQYRLVPSRYLCVLGVREDWGLG